MIESGGIVASTSPGTKFPGKAGAEITIKVKVKDPSSIDVARLADVRHNQGAAEALPQQHGLLERTDPLSHLCLHCRHLASN